MKDSEMGLPGICEGCGKPGAKLQEDPFLSEIHDDDSLHWLCEDCAHESAMDI